MAITVTDAGTNTFTTVATQNITTTTTAAAGGLILVGLAIGSSSAWGVTDSAGNTYTAITPVVQGGAHRIMLFYARNCLLLASGSTITASWTTNATGSMAAAYVTGLDTTAPFDLAGTTGVSASSSSETVTTGTLSQASELVVGALTTFASPGTFTEATGFTGINNPTAVAATDNIRWAYQAVSSTASVTYNPSWTSARTNAAGVWSFKAAAVAAAPFLGMALDVPAGPAPPRVGHTASSALALLSVAVAPPFHGSPGDVPVPVIVRPPGYVSSSPRALLSVTVAAPFRGSPDPVPVAAVVGRYGYTAPAPRPLLSAPLAAPFKGRTDPVPPGTRTIPPGFVQAARNALVVPPAAPFKGLTQPLPVRRIPFYYGIERGFAGYFPAPVTGTVGKSASQTVAVLGQTAATATGAWIGKASTGIAAENDLAVSAGVTFAINAAGDALIITRATGWTGQTASRNV